MPGPASPPQEPVSINGIFPSSLNDSVTAVVNASDASKSFEWDLSGATTGTTTTLAALQTANRTITLPNATDTLVGKATTDALTNKDLTSGTNTFPTFNQNTTGSAATLTTARTIWGQSFDGSANVDGSITAKSDSQFLPQLILQAHFDSTAAGYVNFGKTRGTTASPTAVQNGDALGTFVGQGYSGGSFNNAAYFGFSVDGAPSGTHVPGKIIFTTVDVSGNGHSSLQQTSTGNLTLGAGSLSSGATDGWSYMSTTLGKPTGVPTAISGFVPFEYDATNNKISVYNSGWKQTAALT